MKTLIHLALIILIGCGIGLLLRRGTDRASESSLPSDAIVYTDTNPATDVSEVHSEPTVAPEGWMSEFELTERSGKTISSEQLKGTPYLVSFFFTTCPSICIQQNQKLKQLQDEFKGQPVRFLSITVDPETDDLEKLREYAARFDADADQWLFLTGDLTYIRRVGAEVFQQPVNKQFHTEKFVLVDRTGKIVGFYAWPDRLQFERLQTEIKKQLDADS